MKAYVFKAGAQQAVSIEPDGSNLPPPKVGQWEFLKEIDLNVPGLIGLDPEAIAAQGYQIWPS